MAKSVSTSSAPAKSVKGAPYRTIASWHAAHAAVVGAVRGNASARATAGVLTHLAWRAPGASVAWNKGTNAAMLAHAESLGITVGMPVHVAVGKAVSALPTGATTTALRKETTALAPSA